MLSVLKYISERILPNTGGNEKIVQLDSLIASLESISQKDRAEHNTKTIDETLCEPTSKSTCFKARGMYLYGVCRNKNHNLSIST